MAKLLTTNQAAKVVKRSPRTVRRWALDGKVFATKTPQGWVYEKRDLK